MTSKGYFRGQFGNVFETAVDHFMNLHNLGEMEDYDGFTRSISPCSDSICIRIKVKDGIISEIFFITDG